MPAANVSSFRLEGITVAYYLGSYPISPISHDYCTSCEHEEADAVLALLYRGELYLLPACERCMLVGLSHLEKDGRCPAKKTAAVSR